MYNSVLCYLEKIVEEFPEKKAVSDEKETVTFRQLRKKALNIAAAINDRNIGRRVPVFIYLPKSADCIAAFTGVLYSGNFYTPTDVRFPYKKVQGILDTLCPSLLITNTQYKQVLLENGYIEDNILNLDEINYEKDWNGSQFLEGIISTDPVYVLFTSGSTGKPKGVIINNRCIIDYIDWVSDCYDVDKKECIGSQAPFYFDNSTFDVYLCLTRGVHLQIIPEKLFSFPAMLMEYVIEKQITMILWVPSVLINVANACVLEKMDCRVLKKILFAGEVMPNKQLNYWRKHIPDALYSNLYGPTETTVDCTYYIVDRDFKDDDPLPIGKQCQNTDVFLLTEENKRVEKENETGEICVRGDSLSFGYWGNEVQTNKSFVQNPLNTNFRELIYRTGDLAYYNNYGELIFSGRKDFQIKHMGYRIELGEIEAAAFAMNGIEIVCVMYEEMKKNIVLFYTGMADELSVRKFLIKQIPKYMVPTKYYRLDSMPLNDNGKIDRILLRDKYIN